MKIRHGNTQLKTRDIVTSYIRKNSIVEHNLELDTKAIELDVRVGVICMDYKNRRLNQGTFRIEQRHS